MIPAVEYFGWLDSDGTVHQARVIAYLTYRYRALDFLRSIQQPGNEHYEAWCELTTPAGPGAMRGRVLVRKIHRLLTTVRTAYPDLEDRFDPRRLDLWDPRRTAPPPDATPRPLQKPDKDHTPRNILIAIVVVVFLANLLQLFAPHPPRTAPVTPSIYSMPLVRAEPDIDRAIRARFGNDAPAYATILKRNPKLAKALSDLWASEKVDGASQGDFATEVEPLLNNWYWYGVRNGGLALVTDYQRLTLDMAKALRERSASECNRYLESSHRWTPFLGLPQSFGDRDTRLMFRTLLETDGSNRSEDLTAMVPGEIVDALPKRSGAPKALIDRWFKSRNIGVQECDVTIAYMELVLARARPESLAMLRGM